MKFKISLMILALVALFVGAQAQASVFAKAENGHGKVIVTSYISKMDTTMVGRLEVTISNNGTMIPVIQSKIDSVKKERIVVDTLTISAMYPVYVFVNVRLITKDTSGAIDTANTLGYIIVLITPKLVDPTLSIQGQILAGTTDTLLVDFTSGFDKAYVSVTMSYGDTDYSNPSTVPAYLDSVFPNINNLDQKVSMGIPLQLGSNSYPFSGTVKIWNSVGDTISGKFIGITLPKPAPAMVSSAYAIHVTYDSIIFTDQTVNYGIKCRHIAYIYDSSSSTRPIDSISLKFAESNTAIITKNSFGNLQSNKKYWINSGVIDTIFKVMHYSNRVLVQTLKKPIIFELRIDSNHVVGISTQRTYCKVTVGNGHTGFASILMSKFDDQNNLLIISPLKNFSSGINNFQFDLTNLSVGEKYIYTIYGYDTSFTNSYSPWVLSDTFTFKRPVQQGTGVDFKGLNSSMVYCNPSSGWVTVNTTGPYEILNLSGTTVQRGILEDDAHIDVSTLPRGIFIVRTEKGSYKFAN